MHVKNIQMRLLHHILNLFLNVLKFRPINSMNLIFYEPSVHTSNAYILDAANMVINIMYISVPMQTY